MAKIIKESKLKALIAEQIRKRLKEEEELDIDMKKDVDMDMDAPSQSDPKQDFIDGISDLERINQESLGNNEKIDYSLKNLRQQFENAYEIDNQVEDEI